MSMPYEGCGYFEEHWRNPPAPFNPLFDPKAKTRYERVTKSMEEDGYYASHTREECKNEWARRYEALKIKDDASLSQVGKT